MNYIDIVLCVPLIWGAYKGFSKGFVIEVASLAALLLGVYGGIKFADFAADFLTGTFSLETKYMPVIAFAVTFIIIVIGVFALAKLLEKFLNVVSLKFINKLAGAAFGLLKIGMILSVILVIIDSVDQRSSILPRKMKKESLLYEPVSRIALTVIPAIKNSDLFKDTRKDKEITINP